MAGKTGDWVRVSGYLFILGVIISVVAGVVGSATLPWAGSALVVLGTVVGLLAALGWGSVSKDESETFLLATIALLLAGAAKFSLKDFPSVGGYLGEIVGNLAALAAPAAVIVAIEAIWRAGSVKIG